MPKKSIPRNAANLGPDELSRKEQFLAIAMELFAQHGFRATSIRSIADKAGTSVSHLYHYFPSKEDVWDAAQEYAMRFLPARLEAIWDEHPDPLERFKLLLREHVAISRAHQMESKIFTMDQSFVSKMSKTRNSQGQKRVLNVYIRHIDSLRDHGYIKTGQSKILALNIFGVLTTYARWYKQDGALPADVVINEVINFILYGCIGNPPTVVKEK